MRAARFALLILCLCLSPVVWAQQAPTPVIPSKPVIPPSTASPAVQDPQALSIINQVLAGSGGAPSIKAIADYTATGKITYHWNPEVQGTVTIVGLGLYQFRIDANLPSGPRTSIISNSQMTTKAEDGSVSQYPPAYPVPSSDAYPYQPPMFPGGLVLPHAQLVAVLNNPRYNISYKGLVQVDGQSAYGIQVQRIFLSQTQPDSMTEYHSIDFFIDPNALQVIMTQDHLPKHILHQIRYSGYSSVSGVSVPLVISEQMDGQVTQDIQLSQISFNGGLQASAFSLQ